MQDTTSVSVAPHPRRFSFDTLAIWALTLTAAVAAIAFVPVATIPFLYTKISIIAIGGLIALVLYILARLTRGNVIVPPLPLLGSLWLVPLAYVLSTLFSGAGVSASLFGTELETDTLGFMLLLALAATLAALVFRRTSQYRVFFNVGAIVLGIALVAQIIILIVSKFNSNLVSSSSNLIGSFTDFGMFVCLGFARRLFALRFLTLSKRTRITLWVMTALAWIGFALVNSSLVWI